MREHLRLYASFAGVPERLTPDEVVKRAKEVNLGDKLDELASNLSGGQRRKLSLAIAFIGSPKVLFIFPLLSNTPFKSVLWKAV